MAKVLTKHFNGMANMAAWINNTAVCGWFKEHDLIESAATGGNRTKFSGTADFDTAQKLLQYGWKKGADDIKAFTTIAGHARPAMEIVSDIVGYFPNVANYLAGRPDSMFNIVSSDSDKRIITIIYNISIAYDVKTKEITAAAAKLLDVIAGLEKSGVGVELFVSFASKDDSKQATETAYLTTKIKGAEMPLNLLSVAYPLTHPSMLRRHYFAAMERIGVNNKSNWGNYGYIVTGAEFERLTKENNGPHGVILDYYMIKDLSRAQIAAKLTEKQN